MRERPRHEDESEEATSSDGGGRSAFRIPSAKAEGGEGSRVGGRPSGVPRDRPFERFREVAPEVFECEPLLAVGEESELGQGFRQKLHAPGGPLPSGGLVETGGDLDETLEEKTARADGGEPLGLPYLVRLEEPAGVEETPAGLEPAF